MKAGWLAKRWWWRVAGLACLLMSACSSDRVVTPSAPPPTTAPLPPICRPSPPNRPLTQWLKWPVRQLIAWSDVADQSALGNLSQLDQRVDASQLGLPITLGFALRNLGLELRAVQRIDQQSLVHRTLAVRVVTADHDVVWLSDSVCDHARWLQHWQEQRAQMLAVGSGFVIIPAHDDPSPFEWFSPDGLVLGLAPRHRGRAVLGWMLQASTPSPTLIDPTASLSNALQAIEGGFARKVVSVWWQGQSLLDLPASPAANQTPIDPAAPVSAQGDQPLAHLLQVESAAILLDGKTVGKP